MEEEVKLLRKHRLVHHAETYDGEFGIKMTHAILRYGHQDNVAIINHEVAGKTAQNVFGFGGEVPFVASLKDAMQHKPDALVMASCNSGGVIPDGAVDVIKEAIQLGLDVYLPYHTFLSDDPEIAALAKKHNVTIVDLRKPPKNLHIGNGEILGANSYICTTVGTGFSIGKMSTTLELQKALQTRKLYTEFIATGQSAIMATGHGIVNDALPSDFGPGVLMRQIMNVDGCDVVLVEGQGAILNINFSGVAISILHGSCPDGMILCHRLKEDQDIALTTKVIRHTIVTHLSLLPFKKSVAFLGISLNSKNVDNDTYKQARDHLEKKFKIPVLDPFLEPSDRFAESLIKHKAAIGK